MKQSNKPTQHRTLSKNELANMGYYSENAALRPVAKKIKRKTDRAIRMFFNGFRLTLIGKAVGMPREWVEDVVLQNMNRL